ncbi:MAG: tRNA preQ1(34) S-adenosylmethionine ribosyltransferase-isomerase QueA [bacterium]
MKTSLFNFTLPEELVAQKPAPRRDSSNLMVLQKKTKKISAGKFRDIIKFFRRGDVLVLNNTKVIPARIITRRKTGGKLEIFLLKKLLRVPGKNREEWECLVKPLRKVKPGEIIRISGKISCKILAKKKDRAVLLFSGGILKNLKKFGRIPLPPYIRSREQDTARYQTVFASEEGAVAAPTAGLHFTKKILNTLKKHGVEICFITLHTGYATFNPIKTGTIEAHEMEDEFFSIPCSAAKIINSALAEKRRVFACGTTVVRTLEGNARRKKNLWLLKEGTGRTKIYIKPPYKFKIVTALITNFHIPESSLLVLVSAFAGRTFILKAYEEAIRRKWRFFSFGDAMLII